MIAYQPEKEELLYPAILKEPNCDVFPVMFMGNVVTLVGSSNYTLVTRV